MPLNSITIQDLGLISGRVWIRPDHDKPGKIHSDKHGRNDGLTASRSQLRGREQSSLDSGSEQHIIQVCYQNQDSAIATVSDPGELASQPFDNASSSSDKSLKVSDPPADRDGDKNPPPYRLRPDKVTSSQAQVQPISFASLAKSCIIATAQVGLAGMHSRRAPLLMTVIGCVATSCGFLSILGTQFPENLKLWLTDDLLNSVDYPANSRVMEQPHKAHRTRKSGSSAKKKSKSDKNKQDKKQNPRAFAFTSSVKAKRLQSRAVEKDQRRLHIPTIDRSYGEPPPFVVVVQGPPQVGKSLLIKSLIKHYTKHNVPEVRGPITIVSGKQRRLQFVECPNDINGMIDCAKIADLALLLVDGSYGFEMETFEFLNLMQNHGLPRVMGVLTHLDKFKDVKKLRKTKQRLKHRFWTEIYDGAKLFYLSGLIHGKYSKREIRNLARFISVMKFPPLSWRTSHPYVLVDRFEDVTPPERVRMNNKCDRNVTIYGYLRGCNLKKGIKVHIAGVGDYSLAGVTGLADPCPLPSAAKKKGLRDKEKLFYAPMSGLGDLLYDKDAVYININDHFVQFSKVDDENGKTNHKGMDQDVGETLVKSLQNTKYSIDEKLENSFISLFSRKPNVSSDATNNAKDTDDDTEYIHDKQYQTGEGIANGLGESQRAEDMDGSESSDEETDAKNCETIKSGDNEDKLVEHVEFNDGRLRRKAIFGKAVNHGDPKDSDEEDEDNEHDDHDEDNVDYQSSSGSEEGQYDEFFLCGILFSASELVLIFALLEDGMGNISKWKESLLGRTAFRQSMNLKQLVYGKSTSLATSSKEVQDSSEDEETDDDFFKPKGEGNKKLREGMASGNVNMDDCSKFKSYEDLKYWKGEEVYESIRDRFVTGDWSKAARRNQVSKANSEDDDRDDAVHGDFEDLETGEKHEGHRVDNSGSDANEHEDESAVEERRLKKLALRAKFDAQYPFSLDFLFLFFIYISLAEHLLLLASQPLIDGFSMNLDADVMDDASLFCFC
ncbi:hypothetical protein WN943_016112 [Citrus x changshan-huyou]